MSKMYLCTDGFIVQTAEANVTLRFDPAKHSFLLHPVGPNTTNKKLDLVVAELSLRKESERVSKLLRVVDDLQKQIGSLSELLDKVYYSPGMPGFLEAQSDWDSKIERDEEESVVEDLVPVVVVVEEEEDLVPVVVEVPVHVVVEELVPVVEVPVPVVQRPPIKILTPVQQSLLRHQRQLKHQRR